MREQLSFDHARPAGINISWWAMKVIGQHGNAECVANASSTEREPTTASAATTTTVVSGGRGRRLREIIPASEAEAAMLALSGLWPTYQPMVVPDVASPAIARSTAVASPAIAPSAAVASTVAAASPVPMSLHHAVCVTGLTRSFAEIGAGVRSRVFGLLAGSASHVRIETFGVRPANDTWSSVRAHLGPFSGLEKQVPCRPAGEPLPAFFTCQRGRTTHRMDTCTSSFVQMQCDLAHCDAMIARHEAGGVGSDAAGTGARIGASTAARQFDYVTWMRLDVAWEVDLMPALPLPALATDRAGIIWLPQMNSQQAGLCDKFAFGTRAAMHKCVPQTAVNSRAWLCRAGRAQPSYYMLPSPHARTRARKQPDAPLRFTSPTVLTPLASLAPPKVPQPRRLDLSQLLGGPTQQAGARCGLELRRQGQEAGMQPKAFCRHGRALHEARGLHGLNVLRAIPQLRALQGQPNRRAHEVGLLQVRQHDVQLARVHGAPARGHAAVQEPQLPCVDGGRLHVPQHNMCEDKLVLHSGSREQQPGGVTRACMKRWTILRTSSTKTRGRPGGKVDACTVFVVRG